MNRGWTLINADKNENGNRSRRGTGIPIRVYPRSSAVLRRLRLFRHHLAFVSALALVSAVGGSSPASLRAADAAPLVVTLGDSITKGVRPGVTTEQTFAALVEAGLQKDFHGAQVVNVGIGGERTDQALKRLEKEVLAKRPALVTVMYGTNDSYVDQGKSASRLPLETYRANLTELVSRLQKAGAAVVLMTEPRWGAAARKNGLGEHPNERLEPYVKACRLVARETGVPLVDHFEYWTLAEQGGQDLGQWTTDQCHPNAEGHRIMAELMAPVVHRALNGSK